MKWLLVGVLVLVISVSVALVALPDPGYVLIGYGNTSIETSILVFIVVLGLVYLALRVVSSLWRVPTRVQQWGDRRHNQRLHTLYNDAVAELADGRIERAERHLGRLLKSHSAPLQAYLSAARAASQLGFDDRRDSYLKLALQRNPGAETAIRLTETELQLTKSQLDQAQTTLTRLQALSPRNSQVLRLSAQLYLQQEDWKRLRHLLPDLLRARVLDADQWQQLAVKVYHQQVLEFSTLDDLAALQGGWKQLPAPVRQDEGLMTVYIEQLIRLGADRQADRLLREQIRQNWNRRLLYLFGNLDKADASAQLPVAERWLEENPHDAVLLLTLGKICLRNQLWGKARSYLERSISEQATTEAYRLLGSLLEQLGEVDKAADCYRKGVELSDTKAGGTVLPEPEDESSATGKAVPISAAVLP
jgi:HemY protein